MYQQVVMYVGDLFKSFLICFNCNNTYILWLVQFSGNLMASKSVIQE